MAIHLQYNIHGCIDPSSHTFSNEFTVNYAHTWLNSHPLCHYYVWIVYYHSTLRMNQLSADYYCSGSPGHRLQHVCTKYSYPHTIDKIKKRVTTAHEMDINKCEKLLLQKLETLRNPTETCQHLKLKVEPVQCYLNAENDNPNT